MMMVLVQLDGKNALVVAGTVDSSRYFLYNLYAHDNINSAEVDMITNIIMQYKRRPSMSTIKTNTLTGTTSAGSIVVTGEGGSTTTNLQQGLAKAWATLMLD